MPNAFFGLQVPSSNSLAVARVLLAISGRPEAHIDHKPPKASILGTWKAKLPWMPRHTPMALAGLDDSQNWPGAGEEGKDKNGSCWGNPRGVVVECWFLPHGLIRTCFCCKSCSFLSFLTFFCARLCWTCHFQRVFTWAQGACSCEAEARINKPKGWSLWLEPERHWFHRRWKLSFPGQWSRQQKNPEAGPEGIQNLDIANTDKALHTCWKSHVPQVWLPFSTSALV